MLQSNLFTKTRKEAPSDEVSKNASLLIRAGYIKKELAGVYSFLPLGLRVLRSVEKVIREEMNAIGGQEIIMTALQDKEVWEKTDRWDDSKVDNWFKTELKSGGETGLAITHEEPLTRIMTEHISSYRDLPKYVYQFQTKFRNEMRAKSGIMRGKEFVMKDLYSFSKDEKEHMDFYNEVKRAYTKIFKRLGIGEITYPTFASGGIFSDFSEEFQTVCDAGEDIIYVDEDKKIAINREVYNDDNLKKLGIDKGDLVEKKSIESGNVFHLGTKFSEPIGLTYTDEEGNRRPVVMGSYGLGPSRLVGTIVEVFGDEKGIVWPAEVAPFKVHLISLDAKGSETEREAKNLYRHLSERKVEVLYDDRELRAGLKFADSDLIGIPIRVVVSPSTVEQGKVEIKERSGNESRQITSAELFSYVEKHT